MRSGIVAAILIVAGIGYIVLLRYFHASEPPAVEQFGAVGDGEALVQIYVEPNGIDAANATMQLRLSLTPSQALRGELVTAPNRNLILLVAHDKVTEESKSRPMNRHPP